MERSKDQKMRMLMIAGSCLVYVILDLPVQLTGYLHFGPYVGMKNFLPVVLGLLGGPFCTLGTCLGGICTGLIMKNEAAAIVAEVLCNLVVGLGLWILWHWRSKSHRVHLKTGKQYLRFLLCLFFVSLCCGLISLIVAGREAVLPVSLTYFFVGTLIGIPFLILFTSLLCVEPVVPKKYSAAPDAAFQIDANPESIGAGMELLEDAAMQHRITMKRVFEIENCIEETSIRILKELPQTSIAVAVRFGDTMSVRIHYRGKQYDPFYKGKEEDELDQISLNLLKHRALWVSYWYDRGENKVHIVV